MSKAIKSTNPIKAIIVKLLKAKSGANRITNVKEAKDDEGNKIYEGDCLKKAEGMGFYHNVGTFSVYEDQVINEGYRANKLAK